MAHVIADRVTDVSTSTGTGNFTVSGSAPTGFRSLDAVLSTTDTFYYCIAHQSDNEWEVGLGTYSGSNVFARTTILSSSNAGSIVNFSAGSKDVFMVQPAQRDNPRLAGLTNNRLLRTDGTLGNMKQSGITVDDSDNLVDVGNVQFKTGSGLRTGSADASVLNIQARDVDGTAWATAFRLTAGDEPTLALVDLDLNANGRGITNLATINGYTPREVLTANRTYYVRTDGSDSNTGLVNSSGGAFATVQKAVDVVGSLDISIYTVTIKLGNTGTFSGGVVVGGPWVGTGEVILEGDTTTPANTVISHTSHAVTVQNSGALSVKHFRMTSSGANCLLSRNNASVTLMDGVDFGAAASNFAHMEAVNGGIITNNVTTMAYTISGGGTYHMRASQGSVIAIQLATITVTGTPAITSFALARAGILYVNTNTYSGSATGARYISDQNGVINTGGGGANYFPGSAAGSTATGGQYL